MAYRDDIDASRYERTREKTLSWMVDNQVFQCRFGSAELSLRIMVYRFCEFNIVAIICVTSVTKMRFKVLT